MRLVTWNINGIRSFKVQMLELLESLSADIICFQETKITRDMLESDIAIVDGYSSYYSFSNVRAGYSGVATYCRKDFTPFLAQEGFSDIIKTTKEPIPHFGNLKNMFTPERLQEIEKEGRVVLTQHKYKSSCDDEKENLLTILNVYCPHADPEKPERLEFKLDFYKALEERAKALIINGSDVIICGDINTSHKPIDHRDPRDPTDFFNNPCRDWMDSFLYNKGKYAELKCSDFNMLEDTSRNTFVDAFRYYHPKRKEAFTCWCTLTGSRVTNYGTRIDYILGNTEFCGKFLADCDIFPDVQGSDHCPVRALFSVNIIPAVKFPYPCTKYLLEFGGKQQKLSDFLKNTSNKTPKYTQEEQNKEDKSDCLKKTKVIKQRQMKLSYMVKPKSANQKTTIKKSISYNFKTSKTSTTVNKTNAAFWKELLKGPEPLPKCSGHNETSVMRTVKKEGQNFGKQFYCCCRPEGKKGNPDARCSYFVWKA